MFHLRLNRTASKCRCRMWPLIQPAWDFTVLSRARSSRTLRHMVHCGAEHRLRNPSPTVYMSKDRPTCLHIESKQIMKRKGDLVCVTTWTVSRIHRTTIHLACNLNLKHAKAFNICLGNRSFLEGRQCLKIASVVRKFWTSINIGVLFNM